MYGNGKDSFGQLNNGLAKMSTPSSPEPKNVILHDRRDSAEVIRILRRLSWAVYLVLM